jgi:drug/metabolite transporter (DMT)-like permease
MIAASSMSGPAFAFWRMWFGAVLIGGLAFGHHRRENERGGILITRTGVLWTIRAGVAFAVHQLLFTVAIHITSVVDVTLMNTLAPLVVAVLAVPMFGERPGVSFRVWSIVAIAGAALVAVAGSSGEHGQPMGVLLAAGNVVFYALFFVWSKQTREHIDPMAFLAGTLFVAAIAITGYALVTGTDLGELSTRDLALVVAVAAFPGGLGHFSVTWSLKWVPANIPPVIMLAIPVLGGVLAWLLLHQSVSPVKIVGGVITLVGVAGAVRSPGARDLTVEALDFAEEP